MAVALQERYGPDASSPWSLGRDLFGGFAALDEIERGVYPGALSELGEHRLLCGHWSVPEVLEAFRAEDVLMLLREPRTRLLSHYTFWRGWTEDEHAAWEPYRASRAAAQPLAEFVADPAVAHQIDNLLCRTVLGPDPRVPLDGFIPAASVPALAREVCDRIDRLGFVDVLERGDDMWRALERWADTPLRVERRNATDLGRSGRIDVSGGRVHELINERSAADLVVWEHVARRCGIERPRIRSDAEYAKTVANLAAADGDGGAGRLRTAAESALSALGRREQRTSSRR